MFSDFNRSHFEMRFHIMCRFIHWICAAFATVKATTQPKKPKTGRLSTYDDKETDSQTLCNKHKKCLCLCPVSSQHTRSLKKLMCVLPASTLCLPISDDSVSEHWRREKKACTNPVWFHPYKISYIFAVHR